jgi:ribosomal protein L6P/L9E
LIYLKIVGVGYRASVEGQTITFKVGLSHDVAYDLPPSMRAFSPEPTMVGIYGIDKNQVGGGNKGGSLRSCQAVMHCMGLHGPVNL